MDRSITAIDVKLSAMKRRVNDVDYVGREEALALLGIKKELLYTYVSRGLVRAVNQPGSRRKLYLKIDLEKLQTRASERTPGPRVSRSLRYGEPVVQTSISEITPEGPRYRGYPALALAKEGRSFEFVADLVWTGVPKTRDLPWPAIGLPNGYAEWATLAAESFRGRLLPEPLVMMATRLGASELGDEDSAADHDAVAAGRRLVRAFTGAAGLLSGRGYRAMEPGEFVAEALLRGYGLPVKPEALAALNAALVLSAEHELSAPAFVARICASTGVGFAACVASALLTQSGPMQAGGITDVEALFAAVDHADPDAQAPGGFRLTDLPCFNHPFYKRDPRATMLVDIARSVGSNDERLAGRLRFLDRVDQAHGCYLNIWAALLLLCDTLDMPHGSAAFLHSLGRVAGWVAHVAEQRLTGAMLRPRARYVGGTPA